MFSHNLMSTCALSRPRAGPVLRQTKRTEVSVQPRPQPTTAGADCHCIAAVLATARLPGHPPHHGSYHSHVVSMSRLPSATNGRDENFGVRRTNRQQRRVGRRSLRRRVHREWAILANSDSLTRILGWRGGPDFPAAQRI